MPILKETTLIIASSIGLIALFSIFEVFSRKYRWNPEEMRRVAHIFGALFGVGIGIYFSKTIFVVAAVSFIGLMAFSRRKHIFNHIHRVSRKTYGEELLPLGLLSAYLISNADPQIFVPAFLITGISDPISGFVMNKTQNRLLSFLFFVESSVALLLIFTPLNLLIILGVALFVGIVEQLFTYGTDNLMVPIAVAVILLKIL
mgnify:CR=1 FL=1